MDRQKVYKIIDGERDYQDRLPPSRTDYSKKTVGDYLTMLQYYVHKAHESWVTTSGNDGALHEIRKIAAICVRCMEEHGGKERE